MIYSPVFFYVCAKVSIVILATF